MTEDVDNKSKEVPEVKTPVKSSGEVETEQEQDQDQEDTGEEKRRCPAMSPSWKTTNECLSHCLLNISF